MIRRGQPGCNAPPLPGGRRQSSALQNVRAGAARALLAWRMKHRQQTPASSRSPPARGPSGHHDCHPGGWGPSHPSSRALRLECGLGWPAQYARGVRAATSAAASAAEPSARKNTTARGFSHPVDAVVTVPSLSESTDVYHRRRHETEESPKKSRQA